jgi:hypothetical protein
MEFLVEFDLAGPNDPSPKRPLIGPGPAVVPVG